MTTYIGPLPNQLLPNTLADATQVMANFNWIVAQVNANVPSQSGGTFNNITLTGASNIFTGATVYNGTYIAPTLTTPTITNPTVTTGTYASPALTGTPTTPTQAFSDSSTQIVNSAWVRGAAILQSTPNAGLSAGMQLAVWNCPGF